SLNIARKFAFSVKNLSISIVLIISFFVRLKFFLICLIRSLIQKANFFADFMLSSFLTIIDVCEFQMSIITTSLTSLNNHVIANSLGIIFTIFFLIDFFI
ncbi:MAG: hypothetical protein Q8M44_03780, partial [bacterium]|nr:hypothetical protein [bacterium]